MLAPQSRRSQVTILTLATLAASLIGAPDARAAETAEASVVRIEAEAGAEIRTVETAPPEAASLPEPAGEGAMGGPLGPFELDEDQQVEVEAAFRLAEPFTVAPDPALARRYAPRAARPVNRLTIPF